MFWGTCLKTNPSWRSIKPSRASAPLRGLVPSFQSSRTEWPTGFFWILSCEIKASASEWEGLCWLLRTHWGARWASLKQQPLSGAPSVQYILRCWAQTGSSLRVTPVLPHCDRAQAWWHFVSAGSFAILSQPFVMRRNQQVRVHFQQQNRPIFIPFLVFSSLFSPTQDHHMCHPRNKTKGQTQCGLNNSLSTFGKTWNTAVPRTLTQ